MIRTEHINADGHVIWYDPDLFGRVDPNLFDADWLVREGKVRGRAGGRGTALFLHHGGHDLVLRHYRRGGAVGRILHDRYLRRPAADSRAMREFALLSWMRDRSLPVPRPCAARFTPRGIWYAADILTLRIPDSRTLAEVLSQGPLSQTDWAGIGTTIAGFHAQGVFHSDLNCRNILIDAERAVWLIDFDKCRLRSDGAWKARNLDRLHRSLAKEKTTQPGLAWTPQDWQHLLDGYRARTAALERGEGGD
jgi:tRNA A-37 threonylcarbamoyl transferase component Bud32